MGLIYVQVTPSSAPAPSIPLELSSSGTTYSPTAPVPIQVSQSYPAEPASSSIKTQVLQPKQNPSSRLLLLGIGALLGIAGLLGFLFWLSGGNRAIAPVSSPITILPPTITTQTSPTASASPSITPLNIGSLVQLNPKNPALLPSLVLLSEPIAPTPIATLPNAMPSPAISSSPNAIGTIPKDAVLEVLSKRGTTQQGQWIQFRVCSVPIAELDPALISGQQGWIRESEVSIWVAPVAQATPEQQGVCKKTASP